MLLPEGSFYTICFCIFKTELRKMPSANRRDCHISEALLDCLVFVLPITAELKPSG